MPKKVFSLLGITILAVTGILIIFFWNNGGQPQQDPTSITPTLYPKPTPKPVTVNIDRIEIGTIESGKTSLPVTLIATVPNGCTDITDVSTARTASVFNLTITAFEDRGVLCIEKPTPYSSLLNIDITGLAVGSYTVQAGTATTTFTIPLETTTP